MADFSKLESQCRNARRWSPSRPGLDMRWAKEPLNFSCQNGGGCFLFSVVARYGRTEQRALAIEFYDMGTQITRKMGTRDIKYQRGC